MSRSVVAAALVLLGLAGIGPIRACSPSAERAAQDRQLCVDLWNGTKMRRVAWDTIAFVSSSPCRVTLAIEPAPERRRFQLRCALNRFGAYSCPSHAQEPFPEPGWNARTRRGVLVLDHPPKRRLPLEPPAWARRYELLNGYILPFDRFGDRRPGVRIVGHATGSCLSLPERGDYKTTRRCAGRDNWIRDPCFSPTGSVAAGVTLLCPRDRGSTGFVRFLVRRG